MASSQHNPIGPAEVKLSISDDKEAKQNALPVARPYPYRDPSIKPESINEYGKLLDQKEIQQIKNSNKDPETDQILSINKKEVLFMKGQYYAIGPVLGTGGFGSVAIVQNLDDGSFYALKRSDGAGISKKEMDMLKKINAFKGAGTARGQIHLLMELAPGVELFEICKNYKEKINILPATHWIELSLALMQAVQELHSVFKILHRDIKLENFRIDFVSGKATLVDFGSAGEQSNERVKIGKTPGYTAPEAERGIFNEKTEVYALGKTIAAVFDLLTLKGKDYDTTSEVVNEKHPFFIHNEKIPNIELRHKILKLTQAMTHPDPNKRPTLQQCIEQNKQLLEGLLKAPYANMGVVKMSDCLEEKDRERVFRLIEHCDAVVVVGDVLGATNQDFLNLRSLLKEKGVHVAKRLYDVPPNLSNEEIFKSVVELENAASPDRINTYFVAATQSVKMEPQSRICVIQVSDEKERDYKREMVEFLEKAPLTDAHKQLIIGTLLAEVSRLTMKYKVEPTSEEKKETKKEKISFAAQQASSRIKVLNEAIKKLNAPTLTYAQAFDLLNKTQEAMLTTSQFKKTFFKSPAVGGQKTIKKLKEQVEQELKSGASPKLK